MAVVEVNSPHSWSVPSESNLARGWVDQIFKKSLVEYAETHRDRYDFDTIFYSVSYCRARGFFYCIGPPMLNLTEIILPIRARFSTDNGESFHDIECVPIEKSVGIGLNIQLMHVGELQQEDLILELALANGLEKSFYIKNISEFKKDIIINTMQKNNDISWIVDWINYYRLYKVFNFHIYDNGSSDFPELVEYLRKNVSDDTNIKITLWPFRYGIPKIGQSMFAQKASILDFSLKSQNFEWAINCDIDEYIFVQSECETLYSYLSALGEDVGCVQFCCFDAPLVRDIEYPPDISVRDLVWRARAHKEKFKNAFRPLFVVTPAVHFVYLFDGARAIIQNPKDAFYLHALPLNSGWEQQHGRRGRRILSNEIFVQDHRIADRMKLIE